MDKSRKILSMEGLLGLVNRVFRSIQKGNNEVIGNRSKPITRTDCLMTGLAIFGLKYPSLLQFDNACEEDLIKGNIQIMYGVKTIPSDTYLRERLDQINPDDLRSAFKAIFTEVQRGKVLKEFQYLNNSYLISVDGTGFFESKSVQCDNCCVKEHRDGTKSYYHMSYGAALVHPDKKTVIPLAPEQIMCADGATKNDCELNALKRFVVKFRADHPRLKAIINGDSLASKAPHIRLMKQEDMSFIVGVKEADHKALFEYAQHACSTHTMRTKDGKILIFRYANDLPLNDSNADLLVNFIECKETDKKGKQTTFSWVTDITLTEKNLYHIMRGGRARWKIENETFNTLKNQGYHFEHNFGHGYKHLCSVFAMLMYLAFLIDQIAQECDYQFQQAVIAQKRKIIFWQRFRGLFFHFILSSWDDVWNALIHGYKKGKLQPNYSP